MTLDVAYALITEGMTFEQRDKFDSEVAALAGTTGSSTDAEMAQRRAYALAEGEIG